MLTQQEMETHWSASANWLHQRLAEALGLVAQLQGEKAVLALQLANAALPQPVPGADASEPPG